MWAGKNDVNLNFNYLSVTKSKLNYFHIYFVLSFKVEVTIGSEGEKMPFLVGKEKGEYCTG